MKAMESFVTPTPARVNYLNATYGLKSWLFTRDHKRIALLYLAAVTIFFWVNASSSGISSKYAAVKAPEVITLNSLLAVFMFAFFRWLSLSLGRACTALSQSFYR